ncbi:hypothetical protein PR003_g25916, partial [Phytophthora rubi]
VDFLLGESAVLQYAASANAVTTVSTNSGDGDEGDDVIQAREQAPVLSKAKGEAVDVVPAAAVATPPMG